MFTYRTMAEIRARQRLVRELYATGQYSETQLAAEFDLSRTAVHPMLAPRGDGFGTAIREIQALHRHGRKLTDAEVQEIRARYRPHVVTARALAEEYGVSRDLINKIVQGRHRP